MARSPAEEFGRRQNSFATQAWRPNWCSDCNNGEFPTTNAPCGSNTEFERDCLPKRSAIRGGDQQAGDQSIGSDRSKDSGKRIRRGRRRIVRGRGGSRLRKRG